MTRALRVVGLALVGIAVLFFALPLVGLLWRAPWPTLLSELAAPNVRTALWLSIRCSLAATLLALALGLPLALWLARSNSRLCAFVRPLILLPMVLPPVVAGVALLLVFGRRGAVGALTEAWFGWALPFTTSGVIVAELYVAMPFLVLTLEAGLRSFDRRYEEAAATLGAGPLTRLLRVTLPGVAPSLRAGAVVCWARALGEFGATITFAGNLPARTQTMPLAVYLALETNPEAAIALSLLLVMVCLIVLVCLRDRWMAWR